MAGKAAIAAAAVLLFAACAFAQNSNSGTATGNTGNQPTAGTSAINKLVPEPLACKTVAAGYVEVTPAFPARRRLIEEFVTEESFVNSGRKLFQTGAVNLTIPHGSNVVVNSGAASFLDTTFSAPTSSGRKLLAAPFVFYGEVLQTAISQQAVGNYVFDAQAIPFLTAATSPPASSGLTFIQAVLFYPQDASATNVPPYAVSTTGFLPSSPSSPVIVQLETQEPQGNAPSLGLRFDYKSSAPAPFTPFLSVFYTDSVGTPPIGLPAKPATVTATTAYINFAQSFGLFISKNGTLYPGQG